MVIAESLKGAFLMTYDRADGVINLARKYGFQMHLILMNNTQHAEMFELVISKNLSCLNDLTQANEKRQDYLVPLLMPSSAHVVS